MKWKLVIFAILIFFILILVKGVETYEESISKKCLKEKYLSYPEFPRSSKATRVSETGFSKDLARYLLAISFNVELSNCSNMKNFPLLKDFNIHVPVEGKTILGIPRMLAHFFHSDKLSATIIAFSGTWFLDEWAEDFDVTQVSPTSLSCYQPNLMKVSKGFYDMYKSMQNTLKSLFKTYHTSKDTLYLTGHSLGGATSSMCALDFYFASPVLYTFGSPRIIDIKGSGYFNSVIPNSHRIFNTEDIFPNLPPPVGITSSTGPYEHVSQGYFFTENLGDVPDNHMLAYLRHFDLLEKY